MEIEPNSPTARPRLVGRFVASQALVWMLAAPIAGAAVARLAVWIQNLWSPFLIFPLLIGCGLGLLLAGVMRLGQVGHPATIFSGALLAAVVAVAGQHYMSFLDFTTALLAQKPQGLATEDLREAMQGSIDFAAYMRRQALLGRPVTENYTLRGAAAWASWAIDGLLTLLATGVILYLACRAPYCQICRSWYRTTRAGPLDVDRTRRLAAAASLRLEQPIGTAHYRLSHCVGGCGPCRLQLECIGLPSQVAEAWLSAAQRAEAVRVLDDVS